MASTRRARWSSRASSGAAGSSPFSPSAAVAGGDGGLKDVLFKRAALRRSRALTPLINRNGSHPRDRRRIAAARGGARAEGRKAAEVSASKYRLRRLSGSSLRKIPGFVV